MSRVIESAANVDELTGRVAALAAELAELITTGTMTARTTTTDAAALGLDASWVSQLAALETLKSASCAVQAQVTAGFAASQRNSQIQAGVPGSRAGRGIASQIGLARRESPNKGQFLLGLSHSLVQEMPYTLAALARGEINEWRATLIVRETAVLSLEHRAMVDRELCGPSEPDSPAGEGCPAASMGDAAINRAARAIGQRLDPGAAWKRALKAQRGRCVTVRPAPDCMVRLTALLPVVQGVGVYAALCAAADTAIALGQNTRLADADGTADGDETQISRSALMADELVARILGAALAPAAAPADATQAPGPTRAADAGEAQAGADAADAADQSDPAGQRVVREPALELQLIITDRTLFGLDDEPAHLTGYGPIPAPLARRIATGNHTGDQSGTPGDGVGEAVRWIRRLYRQPGSGSDTGGGGLIAMDSRKRLFPSAISRFIIARDQFCRTPWCDALIRHIDHINPAVDGGPTSVANAQGLCEACNYAKQAPGWQQTTAAETGQTGQVVTTTPAGQRYVSSPPPPPGETRPADSPEGPGRQQAA